MATIVKSGKMFIKVTGEIRFRDFGDRAFHYVPGHRWIKSTRKWSGNALLHCVKEYSIVPEGFGPDEVETG
jgi:hypothetical protein